MKNVYHLLSADKDIKAVESGWRYKAKSIDLLR